MKSKLIPILIANLFAASAAVAADSGFTWSGSGSLGLRGERNTASDGAKLNEYRDIDATSPLTALEVKGRGNNYYLNFFGENFARDDQYLDLTGGRYGVFKYGLYDNKLNHNLGWGLRTPLAGAGSANLTGVFRNATYPASLSEAPANWFTFDENLKRDNYGAFFEFTNNSPWHVRVDGNVISMKGTRPVSGMLGNGSGNGFIELPAPVNYKTTNLSIDAGYTAKRGQINVSVLRSMFSNSNAQLNWWNPYMGFGDTTMLPPDNELMKYAANGVLRQLPLNSTLSGRVTYSRLTNNFNVMTTSLETIGGPLTTTTANPTTFSGDHKTYTASFALASSLTQKLDSRLYWNWYDKQNNSSQIVYGYDTNPTGRFRYKKNDLGIDLGYRFNAAHKLSGGYEYLDVARTREDNVSTRDNRFYGEYKNNQFEWLGAKLKYQYMERRSDANTWAARPSAVGGLWTAAGANPPNTPAIYIGNAVIPNPTWFTMADVSNFNQNQVKLVLESSPIAFLDLGADLIYKRNAYTDRPYGRNNEWRQEYALTASYGDPTKFRVTAFADWEQVRSDQAYRSSCAAPAASCDPSQPLAPGAYVWSSRNINNNYLAGIGADWPVFERFALKGSYMWSKTTGGVDFTSTNSLGGPVIGGTTYPMIPFATDNTTKHTLNLNGTFKYTKNWSFTGGYAFERYNYHDDQSSSGFNGYYPYVMNMGAANVSYLNGTFANPSYTAHLYYLTGTYKF